MSPPPRRLSFAVSTSLLTASLSLGAAACDKGTTANPKPEPDDKTVNEGPQPPEPVQMVNPVPEPEPEPTHTVNPVAEPSPEPEQAPEELHVNEGPEPAPPKPAPVPKNVNTRPDSELP